jgi:hypothetical protein
MDRWRIYYRGGRTFSADDGSWDDAPSEGVLLVVECLGDRVEFHQGADHYQLEPDGTVVMRDVRTLLAMIGRWPMSSVKFGQYVSHTEMEGVRRRAHEDARGG